MEAALAALIRIQPQSIAQLAEQVGLQKSNLLAAMAGKRSLPERAQAALLQAMGLDRNGAFNAERLYRWRIKESQHLAPLIGVGGLLGTVVLYGMRPPGRVQALESEYWLLEANSSLLAIVRARQEILRGASIPGISVAEDVVDTPEPKQWWTDGVPRAVIKVMLEQLKARTVEPAVSWDEVRAEAERRGISPAKVMALLSGI